MSSLIWSERLETELCNFICPAGRPGSIISTSDMPSIYIQGSKKGFFKDITKVQVLMFNSRIGKQF